MKGTREKKNDNAKSWGPDPNDKKSGGREHVLTGRKKKKGKLVVNEGGKGRELKIKVYLG